MSIKVSLALFTTVLFFTGSYGQTTQKILVQTEKTSLIFSVDGNKKLLQSYFGAKVDIANNQRIQHESYAPAGGDNLFEPAIRMVHADGNPSLYFKYDSHKVTKTDNNISTTAIVLKDPVYPVTVTLHFAAYYKENVIKAWTEIIHKEKSAVRLTNFASSMLHFDASKYWLTQFHGDWAQEVRIEESQLTSGIKILDTKLGTRSHMYQTPAFLLSLDKQATETEGDVIAGTLAWSGNFQFLFEIDNQNSLRIISGMNPFASEYILESEKLFVTPAFIFTYSESGKGEASRGLHRWARNYGVVDGNGKRFSLLNNWEATYFDFDEKKLSGIFSEATKLGVDLFLLDDGWFANKHPRNSDRAALGDWEVNKAKLPNGITHLVKDAESKGVKFGIWVEPEMVNPKSELYEKHPDWVLKLPNREEHYYRNQLVLDLINPEVQRFVYKVIDDLMTQNPGIAYIKWDCNRMMTNTWSPYLKDKQSHVYIEYTKALYSVLEKLRQKYPKLPMMLCSGGGGRTDYGALQYFTEFWPSDNTDGLERVFIQWGFSNFFPAITLSAHVTSWGKQSLKFRTDVAMMGRLGYDIDLSKFTDKEWAFSKEALGNYKRLNGAIFYGDMYRLISPYEEDRAVLMYADSTKTKAVLFSYTIHTRSGNNFGVVKLQGLDSNKKYAIKEINLLPGVASKMQANGKTYTGDYLMRAGIPVSSNAPVSSVVWEITAE